MRLTGGWVLALSSLAAMAGGSFLVLRPRVRRETVKIASALPRKEAGTQEVVNGILLAIEEHEFRAGRFKVAFTDWDEFAGSPSPPPPGSPIPHDDPDVVAIFGCFDAPLARYVGRADPGPMLRIPMISGWSSWSQATSERWTPATPPLSLQGPAAARAAARWGSKRILPATVPGRSAPGVAEEFRTRARASGLAVLPDERFGYDGTEAAFADRVRGIGPDLLFLIGFDAIVAGRLVGALRNAGFQGRILATEDCMNPSFLEAGGAHAEGVLLLSTTAWPPPHFIARYRARFGSDPDPFAYLGFRACRATLRAIGDANSRDRAAILRAARARPFFGYDDDVRPPPLACFVVRDGAFRFLEELP